MALQETNVLNQPIAAMVDNIVTHQKGKERITISPVMTASAAAAVIRAPPVCCTTIRQQWPNVAENAVCIRRKSYSFKHMVMASSPPSSGSMRFVVAASRSSKEEANMIFILCSCLRSGSNYM